MHALCRLGIDAPPPPGGDECALPALQALFANAGLRHIETTVLDIQVTFSDLEAFWAAQTPSFSPTAQLIARLEEWKRAQLRERLRRELQCRQDGGIAYGARAHAVAGRVP